MKDLMLKGCVKAQAMSMKLKESAIKLKEDSRGDIVQTGLIVGAFALIVVVVFNIIRDPITQLFERIRGTIDGTV